MNLKKQKTPSGHDTLVVDGRFFHSRHDPVREAERAAKDADGAAVVFVLSPGLGYLPGAVKAGRVVCVERHAEIAAIAPELKARVHPSPDELHALALDLPEIDKGRIAVLLGAHRDEDAEYYQSLREAITRAVEKRAEEILTVRGFSALWEENLLANAQRFPAARWITDLDRSLIGRTAVLVAAGPSLETDLPALARMRSKAADATFIACDSALPALLSAGITPDLCITIDPQPVKARSLAALGHIPLVASVLSPPRVLACAKVLYLYGQGHPSESAHGVPKRAIVAEPGGSVATAAAVLALRWGAARIIFVGQDLALPDGRLHVRDAPDHLAALEQSLRFRSIEDAWSANARRHRARRVPSVDGGMVWTTPALDSYRIFLESLAKGHPDVGFFRTSRRGAKMEHVTPLGL